MQQLFIANTHDYLSLFELGQSILAQVAEIRNKAAARGIPYPSYLLFAGEEITALSISAIFDKQYILMETLKA